MQLVIRAAIPSAILAAGFGAWVWLDTPDEKLEPDHHEVRAPLDGRVRQRLVGVGQAVGSATLHGEIFGTAKAEIRLPLSCSRLPFIALPDDAQDTPAEVLLTDARSAPTSLEPFAIARSKDPFRIYV